ncbi:hypothetical protein [Allosediminivita pacifica]|uniref:Argininosuccinate lyase n=1 Tax=Allosediminivita pacifica TaxID=1267769 RepID=A0A2T6B5H8_9RHOB|nr:hypothetical protein [Allosediminivita pacifica]PTX51341.1 hypothetical protein C8N44_10384 [Allosediminivita pacifica]GGA99022.1 hypothetical protein GCM10011324_06590 [Allosediminivita pacifica]
MKWLGVALLLGFLAGCGVDGAPVPPEPEEEEAGPQVHGTIGVGVGSRGVTTTGSVSATSRHGPVSFGLSF